MALMVTVHGMDLEDVVEEMEEVMVEEGEMVEVGEMDEAEELVALVVLEA